MKILFTKDVAQRMGNLERGQHVGVGEQAIEMYRYLGLTHSKEVVGAFANLVQLKRRAMGLSLNRLATEAKIDANELHNIENDTSYRPRPRTISNLAAFFSFSLSAMKELAGASLPKNDELTSAAVRFAACSDNITDLSVQERESLDAFVAYLNQR